MKSRAVCFLVAFAIVFTVVLNPKSSWISRNLVDVLASRSNGAFTFGTGMVEASVPDWVVQPQTYVGRTEAQELTRALCFEGDQQFNALVDFAARNPRKPLSWAVLVRMTCVQGVCIPDQPTRLRGPSAATMQRHLATAINACKTGEELEPDNSYFPLMRAVFYMESSQLSDMESALMDAASKSGYSGHILEQTKIMESALQEAKGYRGELVRIALQASINLPDFSHVGSFSRYMNRRGSMSEKRDLIQVMRVVGMNAEAGIGILLAADSVRQAIIDPQPIDSGRAAANLTESQTLHLAHKFDEKLLAAKIQLPAPTTFATIEYLNHLVQAFHTFVSSVEASYEGSPRATWGLPLMEVGTVGPIVSVGAIVFAAIFGSLCLATTRLQWGWLFPMIPHLICISTVICLTFTFANSVGSWQAPTAIVLGFCQMMLAFLCLEKKPALTLTILAVAAASAAIFYSTVFLSTLWLIIVAVLAVFPLLILRFDLDQRRRLALIVGSSLSLLALLSFDPPMIVAGLMFEIAASLNWVKIAGKSDWIRGVILVAACGLSGLILAKKGMLGLESWNLIFALLSLGVATTLFFVGRTIRGASPAVCTALLLFSGLYLATVGIELKENNNLRLAQTNIFNEGSTIRTIANIQDQKRN